MEKIDHLQAQLNALTNAVVALLVTSTSERLGTEFDKGVVAMEAMLGPTPVSEEYLEALTKHLGRLRQMIREPV